MAISKNPEKDEEVQPNSGESGTEKPKSSPARKLVLLLLLVATIVVVGLEYLPEDSESDVVGLPAEKLRPPAQSPAQPQLQQPTTPQPKQPAPVPTPTPPQYERPPETLFVSSSPSDVPASVPSLAEPALAEAPAPEETVAGTTPPAPTRSEEPSPEPVSPAPVVSAPSPELVAARSPTPSTLPAQADSEFVVVEAQSALASQAVARPLPEGPIPAKVNRYARRLFSRYDMNGDGVIDDTERRQMQGNPATIDYNADGEISLDEMNAYTAVFGRHRRMRLTGSMVEEAVAELPSLYVPTAERDALAAQVAAQQAAQQAQAVPVALVDETAKADEGPDEEEQADEAEPATEQIGSKRFVTPRSRLTGLPAWFLGSDMNGDGQLTVAEYAPNSEKARLADFARYDGNNDGVLTAQECPK